MKLHTLKPAKGSTHSRRRLGRGPGSGLGGTSTRGHKGAMARSGYKKKIGFEGGQMPMQRRLPKYGFEHTETTGGEEKSVYICEIRGRLFYARSFCVFCEIRGRISSTRNFCEFREFRGRTCANKLGVGSVEGIRRAAWVWQGCHTLLRKLPRIARMCTD